MKKTLITLAFLLIALPAYAQEDILTDSSLSDADLTADIEAEVLPTTDTFSFGWENIKYRIQRTFTFNAERKAALDANRLHRLDRKLTACSEIGDEDCVSRIEEHIAKAEEIAQKHIDKREELSEEFKTRFEEWRQKRDSRIETLKEAAAIREANKEELMKEFEAKRDEALEKRDEHLKELHNKMKTNIEQRKQNQEHLIETRSQNLKDSLDDTRDRVQERQDQFDSSIKDGARRLEDTRSFRLNKNGSRADINIEQHTTGSDSIDSNTSVRVEIDGEEIINE